MPQAAAVEDILPLQGVVHLQVVVRVVVVVVVVVAVVTLLVETLAGVGVSLLDAVGAHDILTEGHAGDRVSDLQLEVRHERLGLHGVDAVHLRRHGLDQVADSGKGVVGTALAGMGPLDVLQRRVEPLLRLSGRDSVRRREGRGGQAGRRPHVAHDAETVALRDEDDGRGLNDSGPGPVRVVT